MGVLSQCLEAVKAWMGTIGFGSTPTTQSGFGPPGASDLPSLVLDGVTFSQTDQVCNLGVHLGSWFLQVIALTMHSFVLVLFAPGPELGRPALSHSCPHDHLCELLQNILHRCAFEEHLKASSGAECSDIGS